MVSINACFENDYSYVAAIREKKLMSEIHKSLANHFTRLLTDAIVIKLYTYTCVKMVLNIQQI